ncbi:amidohydrolase family protein [Steroidobacter sp.]|uniref:amidohydrolase family protein n=1 Tax=Steroidobacter sp. TaxID=1978227 RepID=UPI001A4BB7EF|nr:amidohydrolase family protein [Steroidobacter sp.]MBL8270655.1 amidohydrolase [Steroidobacter sp.]
MQRRSFLQSALVGGALAALDTSASAAAANGKRPYKLLPCEEAFTIPEILEAARKHARNIPSWASGPIVGPALPLLMDLGEGRLRGMDAAGIDMQILSLGSPGVQNFDVPTAVSLGKLANDRLAAAIKAHPTRFAGLATFAPQDPAAAVKELERCANELKLTGALVNSHTNGEYLDDPKYWPILEALEALNLPLYIHPRDAAPGVAGAAVPGFTVGWGFAVETGTHALRLIGAGIFDRFPKLTIVLGHMGEGIPYFLERIDNRWDFENALFPTSAKLKRKPGEYFRNNFLITTSGMNVAAPLAAAIATVGIDRILFAVDYPFENQPKSVADFDAIALSVEDKRKICETNVRRTFRL